jgi:hypothetical protein
MILDNETKEMIKSFVNESLDSLDSVEPLLKILTIQRQENDHRVSGHSHN